jgi:hypothetical protein
MELIAGDSLAARLAVHRRLPEAEAVELARQVAAALAEAHAQGIVHRDLKPSNLLYTERDGAPFVKIIDFGISKVLSPDTADPGPRTRSGALLGTPLYMAPEQARGAPVDHRVDVYGLGVVLYELATGTRAFASARAPREVAPDLSAGLERVIVRAIAPDARDRYPSMAAFEADLRALASGRRKIPRTALVALAVAAASFASVYAVVRVVHRGAPATASEAQQLPPMENPGEDPLPCPPRNDLRGGPDRPDFSTVSILGKTGLEAERELKLDFCRDQSLGTLFNLAEIFAQVGAYEEAVAAYRRFLELFPLDASAPQAVNRMALARLHFARVFVSTSPPAARVTIDGRAPVQADGAPIVLPGGRHELAVTFPGFRPVTQSIFARAGADTRLRYKLPLPEGR